MLRIRRAAAVVLVLLLMPVFLLALIGGRVNATVLDAGFVKHQLNELGVYERVQKEAVAYLVESFTDDLEGDADDEPNLLAALGAPTSGEPDAEHMRAAVTPLVEAFLEPEWLRRQAEAAIDGFLPWFSGRTDDFAIPVSLHDSVRAAFLPTAPSEPSLFATAWVELEMGRRMIGGMIESHLQDEEREPLDEATRAELEDLLAAESEGAGTWFDRQVLGAVDAFVPFLLGDVDGFTIEISFEEHPALTVLFSEQVDSDPDSLRAEGWRLTDVDLREQMEKDGHDLDERLAIFRPDGRTYVAEDLRDWLDGQRAAANTEGADTPPDIEQARRWVARARTSLTWGLVLASTLLIAAVGVLGGQTWPGRALWSGSALLIASGVAVAVTGPFYEATAAEAIREWAAERRGIVESTEAPGPGASIGADFAEHATSLADHTFARMRATARNWLLFAAVAIGGAFGWHVYERRRESRDDGLPDIPWPDDPPSNAPPTDDV